MKLGSTLPRLLFFLTCTLSCTAFISPKPVVVVESDVMYSKARIHGLFASREPRDDETKSLAIAIDDLGRSFKSVAQGAAEKSESSTSTSAKALFSIKACVFFLLFISYRAFRGVFVLSPAIFKRVYEKLSELDLGLDTKVEDSTDGVNPNWRTKITVSVLSSVVVFSYFLTAILKVAKKFFQTIAKTTSAIKSFDAAAQELLDHEDTIAS